MKDPCPACGSDKYHRMRFAYSKSGVSSVTCSECDRLPMTPCYDDIYLGGGGLKTDENICHPKTGVPIPFVTKQDKAVAMRIAGVKQALSAERVHGYRNESHLNRKTFFEVR